MRKGEGSAIKSFCYPLPKKDIMEEVEKTAKREGKSLSELIMELLEEYQKKHGSGNPAYCLDKWTNDPEFIAIPALLANKEQRNKWLQLQVERKNWKDLGEIKYTLQEWQHQLKRLGV